MNDNPKPGKNGFKFPEHSIKTKITDVKPNELVTRGYNQEDLITNLSFAEMVFLLLRERLPDERESKIFNHILVIASSGANINNAVAGGLLSFGKNHAGAIEKAMELFQESISSLNLEETADEDVNRKIAAKAIEIVDKYQSESKRVPGYGHRYHEKDPRAKDPRAVKLLDLAIMESSIGPHTKLALVIESILSDRKGICLNVDGVNAGLLSDLGFDSSLGLGIFMIGRLPGLIAHAYEEMEEEEKFRRFCDLEDIVYEGFKNRDINEDSE